VKDRHAINLSNGLVWLDRLQGDGGEPDAFIRLQSTWCEQKLWDDILNQFDATLLFWLATGEKVTVYDATVKPLNPPRALWQGLAVVRAACRHAWGLEARDEFSPGGCNISGYLAEVVKSLDRRTIRRLRYFRRLCWEHLDDVHLHGRHLCTDLDGNLDALDGTYWAWVARCS
jgi:hypothetical protein